MVFSNPQILPCPLEERRAALEVLYQNLSRPLRACLIDEILDDSRCGQVDLSGLWIARQPGWGLGTGSESRLVGALLTQALAGRAVAVWAPEVRPSWKRAEIAARLVRTVLDDLQARGTAIVQAVLDESATPRNALDLSRGGMPCVTDLIYMQRDTTIPLRLDRPPAVEKLQWRGLDEVGADAFRRTLQASYAGSLDMPELEGVRTLDDVIEAHRGAGDFFPERWRLGTLPDDPDAAAVLLLSAAPGREVWEVVYLGLTPQARGRGLGSQVVAHALDLARPHVPLLELAADARNEPALKLYQATGFVPYSRRSVHLVVFPKAGRRA